jgi:hypothetical protein
MDQTGKIGLTDVQIRLTVIVRKRKKAQRAGPALRAAQ